MEISQLLDQMQADGTINRITSDPAVQFGTATRRYIGAELLPERNVTVNMYRETKISYRTLVANHGSRYAPAQRKNGKFVGHFDVVLSDSDIADEFTAEEYDALVQMITPITGPIDGAVPAMSAIANLTKWIDKGINLPLVEVNEVMRWQALVAKAVVLRGDNGYRETINYPSYADLSFAAADWTNDAIDPWDDIAKIVAAFAARGVTIRRIITGAKVVAIMQKNAKVRARAGHITISGGAISAQSGFATLAQINVALAGDNLPPVEQYDLQYRTSTGSHFFLDRRAMVFVGQSDNEETIDLGDGQFETLEGTLGYTAIGRGAGRSAPGRFIRIKAEDDKPPRVDGQGWQTSVPVIQEPELVGVINTIGPA